MIQAAASLYQVGSGDSLDISIGRKKKVRQNILGKIDKIYIQDLQVVSTEGCESNPFLCLALGLTMKWVASQVAGCLGL